MYTFTEDAMEDNSKQESLEFIRSQIINMVDYGIEGSSIDNVVRDVDLEDIDNYMDKLIDDKDLPFSPTAVEYKVIKDEATFRNLCDYTRVNRAEIERSNKEKIYFIQAGKFILTFIPIQLEENVINIYMEPLKNSPKFINDIRRSKLRMEDIKFTKLNK